MSVIGEYPTSREQEKEWAEREADYRAAFEAMREALREAADYMGEMGHPKSTLDKARAALALADKVTCGR